MTNLTFTNYVQGHATLIENEFIDQYMPEANGEYVKVYLLLLRSMGNPSKKLEISDLADILECTEKDVVRALEYWKKKGLLNYEAKNVDVMEEPSEDVSMAQVTKSSMEVKEEPVIKEKNSDKNREEFKEIRHVTEQYLGKTLTKTELETILYFYDELKMSADLIEYLIEYCVEHGHKSIHYIKKVAFSWVEEGITTVGKAKNHAGRHAKNGFQVLNAYGIKGRMLAPTESEFVRRWSDEYGFTVELIVEACNRTMGTIHQPSFDYTDSILKKWSDKGVKSMADVKALDLAHIKSKADKKETTGVNVSEEAQARAKKNMNRFNNFEGRTYDNMEELTRQLIESQ